MHLQWDPWRLFKTNVCRHQFSLFLGDVDVCKLKGEQSKALVDKKESAAVKRSLSPPRKRGLFSFVCALFLVFGPLMLTFPMNR
jgi:hypothetical protein